MIEHGQLNEGLDIEDNIENYIIKSGEKYFKVILMEKNVDDIFNKYLILICERKELKGQNKLNIYRNGEPEPIYDIDLKRNNRKIIQIKSNNEIITFVNLFADEKINSEDFNTLNKLQRYKKHIDKLNKEEKYNKYIFLCLKITLALVIVFIFAFLIGYAIYKNKNGDREDIEEEDDEWLSYYIKIYNKNYNNVNNIIIKYNNNNIKYIGPLKDRFAEGNGKYYSKEYNNTIIYEGNFHKGCPNGKGTKYYYKGNEKIGYYNGFWIKSNRSGQGEMHNYTEGSIYEGLWENDKKNGNGTLNYSNGDYYIGGFKNDKFDGKGKGKIHYPNGDLYEGEFKDGKRHGKGKLNYSNGDYHIGGFENDKFDGKGKGKIHYPNGDLYEGEFKDGKRHGQGKLIDRNGNSIISDFKDGISYGKDKEIYYSNGDYYKGDILNGLKEGKGKLTFKNGVIMKVDLKEMNIMEKVKEHFIIVMGIMKVSS